MTQQRPAKPVAMNRIHRRPSFQQGHSTALRCIAWLCNVSKAGAFMVKGAHKITFTGLRALALQRKQSMPVRPLPIFLFRKRG